MVNLQDTTLLPQSSSVYEQLAQRLSIPTEITTEITTEEPMESEKQEAILAANGISPGIPETLSQGSFKTLAEVAQFNPEAYVKRPIFNTDALQFGMYCFEPGQVNPRHSHPQSSEICYFVQGKGEVVVGATVTAVQPGVCVHIPEAVSHEIRNTGAEQMLVVVVQSPLPCKTERSTA